MIALLSADCYNLIALSSSTRQLVIQQLMPGFDAGESQCRWYSMLLVNPLDQEPIQKSKLVDPDVYPFIIGTQG